MKQRCYFHKNQSIQHFCTLKQCTLPLCDQCLQIHQQQHFQKNQSSNVISYQEAYQEVQQTLSNFLKQNQKAKQKSLDKLNNDKLKAIRAVEDYFAQFETKIQEQSRLLIQIQQKIEKIKKGSIKTVIYYYSGDITLRQLHFPEIQEISSSILKCIHDISTIKKDQIQTFRQDINIQREKDKNKEREREREREKDKEKQREKDKEKQREKAQQEPYIQTYQSKNKSCSKKRLIFSNDKAPTPTHKNTNDPYTQNQKKDQKTSYQGYQREKIRLQSQQSQVKNYFRNQNLYREESFNPNTKEMFPIPIMKQRQETKILRQNPVVSNVDFRNLRSKTLDKFPSMAQLTMARENTYTPLRKEDEKVTLQRYNGQFKPGKWNKNKYDQQSNLHQHQRQQSDFSQFTLNEGSNQINNRVSTQFSNRRPLKTTDLQTYSPLGNVIAPSLQSRQRGVSFEVGLRNTVSHNNLQAGVKKMEPLLGDELKKQVLSPLEIRKMLQKKIEERNKVLTQKKQFQLKISTDRVGANNNIRTSYEMGTMNEVNKKVEIPRQRVSKIDNLEMENIGRQVVPAEQRSSMYNTKDTIINQIYRETRY